MGDIATILIEIFKIYSDPETGLLTFEEYFGLYKDFEIYPKEVSLIKIKDIFSSMNVEFTSSDEYKTNKELKLKLKMKNPLFYIDFKRFIYSLCIISIIINSEKSYEEKILFIIKKMSLSEGVACAQKKKGFQ